MNENNTRFNLETHFSRRQAIRFNDSCCLAAAEARFVCAKKYHAPVKANLMSSELYIFIRIFLFFPPQHLIIFNFDFRLDLFT